MIPMSGNYSRSTFIFKRNKTHLIDYKALLHVSYGWRPVMMDAQVFRAAEEGDMNKLERYGSDQVATTPTGNTILHVYLTAQTKPSLGTVLVMLHKWPFLGSQANNKGDTPLHVAARYGHTNIARLLLSHANSSSPLPDHVRPDIESCIVREGEAKNGAREMMRRQNWAGDSALHEAVRCGHSNVLALLLGEEDADFTYEVNRAGESLLYMAADRENLDMSGMILRAFKSPGYNGPSGRTAAHAAAFRDKSDMMKEIVGKEGLEHLTKEIDDQGWTPLHYAAYNLSEAMTKLLLSHDRSAAYVGDKLGKTALHIAASRQGNLFMISSFLRYCPDSFELVDHKGRSVLHFAAESGSKLAVSLILEKNSLRYLINAKDEDGNTPLHLMLASGNNIPKLMTDPRVDHNTVFNKNHLYPLDLVASTQNYNPPEGNQERNNKEDHQNKMIQIGMEPAKGDHQTNITREKKSEPQDRQEIESSGTEHVLDLKEAKEAHLVVAALIATVTFAAGFTMPGGYIQEKGAELGFAALIRSKAFKAFVITNTIALVFSSAAVFIHLIIAMNTNMRKARNLFSKALPLTLYALLSMVAAFITGTYAVLPHPSAFAVAACVVGCLFFVLYGFILSTVVKISIKIGHCLITCTQCVSAVICCQGLCSGK